MVKQLSLDHLIWIDPIHNKGRQSEDVMQVKWKQMNCTGRGSTEKFLEGIF